MGARTASRISDRLVAEGLPPNTPACVVAAIGRSEEKRWHGCLADLANGVSRMSADQPMLIAIGSVVAQAHARVNEHARPDADRRASIERRVAAASR